MRRYWSDPANNLIRRKRCRLYRERNAERMREWKRAWRIRNHDAILAREAVYRETNRDKLRQRRSENYKRKRGTQIENV
jgi:hypothetical protein